MEDKIKRAPDFELTAQCNRLSLDKMACKYIYNC